MTNDEPAHIIEMPEAERMKLAERLLFEIEPELDAAALDIGRARRILDDAAKRIERRKDAVDILRDLLRKRD